MPFQYIGFQPRAVFQEKAEEMLKEITKLMPEDASCSARIVLIDSKFFVQVMFVNHNQSFLAKEVLDPKKEDTSSRSWQIQGIEKIKSSLLEQLQPHLQKAA